MGKTILVYFCYFCSSSIVLFLFSSGEKRVPRWRRRAYVISFRRREGKKFPGSVVCLFPFLLCCAVVCWLTALLLKKKRSFPVDKLHIQSNNTRLCLRTVGSTTPSIDLPCHSDNVNLIRNVPKCLNIKYWNPAWESREVPRFATDDCMGCYPQH